MGEDYVGGNGRVEEGIEGMRCCVYKPHFLETA